MLPVNKIVYFSPQPSPLISNEYISSFNDALRKYFTIVNDGDRFRPAVIKEFFASFKVDYFILNWPEDIVIRKGGLIQLWLGFLNIYLLKLAGGKLVWICHNRLPHENKYRRIRVRALNWYIKHADLILTHAKEAEAYLRVEHNFKGDLIYFPHPVYTSDIRSTDQNPEIQSDILIWGNITPYKGILEFIQEYKKRNCRYRVNIIGKCNYEAYFQRLKKVAEGLPVHLQNTFLPDSQLSSVFEKTRLILLPYNDETIFASGSLIHSLMSEKIILGPASGNFRDLGDLGCCFTFSDYDSLFKLLDEYLMDYHRYEAAISDVKKSIDCYKQKYTWTKMAEILNTHLS